MKQQLKRLKFYHWIAILLAVLALVLGIRGELYPIPDAWALSKQMSSAADSSRLPKDSYSYICVDYYDTRFLIFNEKRVVLEIGVIDEAAVDRFLASWDGEGWDKLVKVPGDCSVAKQEEFARRAKEIYWGPGAELVAGVDTIRNFPGSRAHPELFLGPAIDVSVKLSPAASEAVQSWQEMPQQLKDLAQEMGVPESIIHWDAPTGRAEPSEDLVPEDGV